MRRVTRIFIDGAGPSVPRSGRVLEQALQHRQQFTRFGAAGVVGVDLGVSNYPLPGRSRSGPASAGSSSARR
jgi:hypothetical protein